MRRTEAVLEAILVEVLQRSRREGVGVGLVKGENVCGLQGGDRLARGLLGCGLLAGAGDERQAGEAQQKSFF